MRAIDGGYETRFFRQFPGLGFLPFRRRARLPIHRSERKPLAGFARDHRYLGTMFDLFQLD